MFLPGFDDCFKSPNETSIDYARRLLDDLYFKNDYPWSVAYSGGKDSTLILQLVCEVSEKYGFKKPLFVVYNDTGVDCGDKETRIDYVFGLLRRIGIVANKIYPENGLFCWIVGCGYPIPQHNFRYCTKYLKVYPSEIYYRSLSRQFGGVMIIEGVRKEESTNRRRYLTRQRAPLNTFAQSIKYQLFEFRPIADVLTAELWDYLNGIKTFYWGETIDELRLLYTDNAVTQRDGCWCCTVANEKSFNDKATTQAQNAVRQYLRVCHHDISMRNLAATPKQQYYLETKKLACGRFTLDARKKIFAFIENQEKQNGEILIPKKDKETIFRCWEYVERTGDGLRDLNTMLKEGAK